MERTAFKVMARCLLVFICLSFVTSTVIGEQTQETSVENVVPIVFTPLEIEALVVNEVESLHVLINSTGQEGQDADFSASVRVEDPSIAEVVGNTTFVLEKPTACNDSNGCKHQFDVQIRGVFIGRTWLDVIFTNLSSESDQNASENSVFKISTRVAVIRPDRFVDKLFIGLVILIMMCANLGMGCKIDLDVVKEVLKKPIAPSIGFCCQFILMPLLAIGIVKTFGLSGGIALGFFATGCSTPGGSSNMYTYLLGGDVSLSITMTLISVTASLAMIPLWMLGVARFILGNNSIRIPYQNIFYTLCSILVPVLVGILIQKKKPQWAKNIARLLRPIFIIFLILVFTFGVWSNIYIFHVIKPLLMLAACLLPYCGFLLGGTIAFILGQPRYRAITIAIEAGIQNTGIPILIMKFSLPQPDADLAAVSPVAIACLMPLPLWIAVAFVEIRKRCFKKAKENEADAEKPLNNVTDDNHDETTAEKPLNNVTDDNHDETTADGDTVDENAKV